MPTDWPVDPIVSELANALAARGGRILVVGGWVRDRLAGSPSKDLDLEVFGLAEHDVSAVLRPFGFTPPVGRQFRVWREPRAGVDVAYPRAGACDYSPARPDSLEAAFRAASRHRDLTINAIGWDPLAGILLDPWKGTADLAAGWLRAVDAETFGADPLRALRVARLLARFEARADEGLCELCRGLDLREVAVERIAGELRRMLLESGEPSRGLCFIDQIGQLELFAPLAALRGVAQDPRWHPEGDVWVHTLLAVDRAVEIAEGLDEGERERLLFAALCHDLGKPETTTVEDGRVRSLGHEAPGAARTREWLLGLRLGERLAEAVATLVGHHLAPSQWVGQGAGARAYRRLARKLAAGGVTPVELERVARADQWGRTTEDAETRRFDAGIRFLEAAQAARVRDGVRDDVVSAGELMSRGVAPGPELGRLLSRCREVQDDTGWQDASRIVDEVLKSH